MKYLETKKQETKKSLEGCLRYVVCLLLFLGITLWGKHTAYAITADLDKIESGESDGIYRITKGTSDTLYLQIPTQTIETTGADGSIQYETAYPQVTKVKNSKPSIVGYNNGVVTGYKEGTSSIKVTYKYVFSSYTVTETTTVYVRVVAYTRSGNTLTIDPSLLENNDITYSLIEASAQVRDLATDADHYAIKIPAGNYTLSDVVHLYSNVTLDMDPQTVITTTAGSGYNMFLLGTTGEYMGQANYNESELCAGYGGFKNITIRGGRLVGNNKSRSCLIRMAHATNVTLDGVTFSGGAGAHQVEVAAIDGFTVKNCTFSDFYGIKGITGNYEALQLDIPCAKSPYEGAYEDGSVMRNVEITGNTFQNLSKGVGSHTMLVGAYHENLKINNNTFTNITNEAIICLNYYKCEIKNNTMDNCGAGIEFEYYLPNRYCIYNTIFDGQQTYNKGIKHKAETVISGNTMAINYHSNYVGCTGINIYGYKRTSAITGAAGNRVKAQNYYVSGVTVADNTIVTAGYGIRLQNAKKCTVTNNTIIGKNFSENDSHIKNGNTYDGIYITRKSSTLDLSGNTIRNMNGGGIYLSESTALGGIKNNTISGVKRYGIYLYSGSNAKVGIIGNSIKSKSEAEALIYLNTTAKTKHYIRDNVLKGYKNNAAIRIDNGKFVVADNTISKVSDGVTIGTGENIGGSVYANSFSSKAASRIRFVDKNYYMSEAMQENMVVESGILSPELPKVKNIKGYEVQVSEDENFAENIRIYRYKKNKKNVQITDLTDGAAYYVRAYAYKTYNGVRIYKNN